MYQLEDVEYDVSKRIHARSRACNARTLKQEQTGRSPFVICLEPIVLFASCSRARTCVNKAKMNKKKGGTKTYRGDRSCAKNTRTILAVMTSA